MATYPTVPETPQRTPPRAGVDTFDMALLAALPAAIGAMLPGDFGTGLQAFANIPAMAADYDIQKEATEQENINKELALTIANQWKPYVQRPKYPDARPSFIKHAANVAAEGSERTRRSAEETRMDLGGSVRGLGEGQLARVVGEIERKGGEGTMRSVGEIIEAMDKEHLDNLMRIAGAEQDRYTTNQALAGQRVQMMLQLLSSPYGVTSGEGIIGQINDDIQFAREMRVKQEQIDAQRDAARYGLFGSLGGSAISATGDIAAAGILAKRDGGGGGGGGGNYDWTGNIA